MRIQPHSTVLPPTPPPEFDLDAWLGTLDEIERRAPTQLALIHFGVADDVGRHLTELRLSLEDWAESVEGGATEEEFIEYALAQLADSGDDVQSYGQAMPFWQSYRGLRRWTEKRARLSAES